MVGPQAYRRIHAKWVDWGNRASIVHGRVNAEDCSSGVGNGVNGSIPLPAVQPNLLLIVHIAAENGTVTVCSFVHYS